VFRWRFTQATASTKVLKIWVRTGRPAIGYPGALTASRMDKLAIFLVIVASALAFRRWRDGFVLCVVVALAQDPLRKLVTGEPVYFTVLVGVVFGAAWLSALHSGVRLGPNAITGWWRQVSAPFSLFVAVVVLQAVHSFARFGSPVVTGIGLMAYLAPVFALVLSYQFAVRFGVRGMRRLYGIYAVLAAVWLATVYAEYLGFDWAVLGEIGEGLRIYDMGTVLTAYSGLFRSSEIAAWHGATLGCLAFMLLAGRRLSLPRLALALAIVAFVVGLGVLTGRRKMLVQIAVFLLSYYALLAWFGRGQAKASMAIFAGAVGIYVLVGGGLVLNSGDDEAQPPHTTDSRYELYAKRGTTVAGDIPERFQELGLAPVQWAINRFGVLGAGLGTGSQGTQHFTRTVSSGAAEGGLGKITMELGVPGLAAVLWLLAAFARYVWRLLEALSRASPAHARLAYGLVAYLIANAAAFSVATQAYGDLFVLLMLGWATGFLLALPKIAAMYLELAARRYMALAKLGDAAPA